MFYQLHRYIREVFIDELKNLFNEHPFYGINPDKKFDREPMLIADSFNIDGRTFPAIIVSSSSATEVRLAMDKFIEEVTGHVRIQQMLPHIIAKIEDDKNYGGTYIDSVVKMEFANILYADKRQMCLRTTTQPATGAQVVKYFPDIAPKQWRTDIVPGARLFINSYNDIEQGKSIYVDTFATKQYLGDLFGTGYDATVTLDVYAGSQYECEEIIDMLTAFFIFIMPQRLNYGHGIVTKTASNSGVVSKEGKLGEEMYKATFEIEMFLEHQFFVPIPKIDGYTLWIEMRDRVDRAASPEDWVVPPPPLGGKVGFIYSGVK